MHKGQILNGRYELLEQLGKGGMGEVWKARDKVLPRDVAIKGLSEESAAGAGNRRRLEIEANTLAGLRHPRIVPILDKFTENDQMYLVMEFIEGSDLQRAGKAGALSESEKVAILTGVLEALTYMHEETSVVHRDLKPANVLLDRKNQPFVADFGIARDRLDTQATQTIGIIGSLSYMAPEVRDGKMATPASDIWSFGAVALWLFTGRTFDAGIPEGNFAGSLTDDIRAALSSRRPAAGDLLTSFRRAQGDGITAAVPTVVHHESPTQVFPIVPQPDKTPAQRARRRWIPILVLVIALAAISGVALALMRPNAAPATEATTPVVGPSSATPTPTPTSTMSASPSPTFSETPSRTASPTAPAAPTGPTWYYLADMSPIEREIEGRPGRCTGGCTGFIGQPGTIAGEVYPQSYVMRMDSDGKRSVSLWNAYTKCTTFEATIGLDDSSASVKTRFLLEREGGATEDLGVLSTGVPKKVSVDLTGVFRFTLVSHLAEVTKQTTQEAVWGDARILCSPLPTTKP